MLKDIDDDEKLLVIKKRVNLGQKTLKKNDNKSKQLHILKKNTQDHKIRKIEDLLIKHTISAR